MYSEKLKSFASNLFKIDAIKFGEFKTKVGLMTPVYCDLRVIVSYPQMMNTISELITEYMKSMSKFDLICGVPYTDLPVATVVSIHTGMNTNGDETQGGQRLRYKETHRRQMYRWRFLSNY